MKLPVEFEALGDLPDGWSWRALQSLTDDPGQDIVDGPFGSNLKASEYVEEGVPIARLQNVDRNRFVDKNIRRLTAEKATSLGRHRFEPGDILLTKLGDPLGKACIVPPAIGGGIIVADLVRIRPSVKRVDCKYLTYALNSQSVIRQLERHTKGTTRPRVNLGIIRELPIPFAPRDQQEGVVAEIEKQFSRLDKADANLKRIKVNLKQYKASVLKAAAEGHLLPIDREHSRAIGDSYETGARLVQRILEDRPANGKDKGRRDEATWVDSTLLPELPRGWVWTTIGQIGQVISGLTKNPKRVALPLKLPYLRVANVYANELRLGDLEQIGVAESELQKLLVRKGDLLIVEGNGSPDQLGRVAMWDGSIQPCVHQNHLIKVRLAFTSPSWVLYWLLSPLGRSQIEQVTSSTSGLHTLSTGKVARLPVPLPPLDEQHRIVAEVERRLSLVDQVSAEVDRNMGRADALRRATLAHAFREALDATQ